MDYTDATAMTNARRLVLVCALLLAAGTISSSQTRPPAETPVDAAVRALNAGRFDQIDSLLKGSTDPRAVVLRAQAEIQRGRYPQAEALLTPAVGSNPGGDAAVELGLLQLYLGRRADGKRTLQRVIEVSPHATTADFLRLGRASRACETRLLRPLISLRTTPRANPARSAFEDVQNGQRS